MQRDNLRREILKLRDNLSFRDRFKKSTIIKNHLISFDPIKTATNIFSYVNFRSEVETIDFIKSIVKKKNIFVPLTIVENFELLAVQITSPDTQLQPGYCNIPEPIPKLRETSVIDPKKIDIVIVPGVVFDHKGGRLGYGGGYYDRFLSKNEAQALRIGLAFEIQMVDNVPLKAHDELMDMVVTEKKVYYTRK